MDSFKAVGLAILLALIGEPAKAESFPAGDVFRPLVADPAEPLLEAYDGPAPFGQYFRHNVSYYGAGVQFDL